MNHNNVMCLKIIQVVSQFKSRNINRETCRYNPEHKEEKELIKKSSDSVVCPSCQRPLELFVLQRCNFYLLMLI